MGLAGDEHSASLYLHCRLTARVVLFSFLSSPLCVVRAKHASHCRQQCKSETNCFTDVWRSELVSASGPGILPRASGLVRCLYSETVFALMKSMNIAAQRRTHIPRLSEFTENVVRRWTVPTLPSGRSRHYHRSVAVAVFWRCLNAPVSPAGVYACDEIRQRACRLRRVIAANAQEWLELSPPVSA